MIYYCFCPLLFFLFLYLIHVFSCQTQHQRSAFADLRGVSWCVYTSQDLVPSITSRKNKVKKKQCPHWPLILVDNPQLLTSMMSAKSMFDQTFYTNKFSVRCWFIWNTEQQVSRKFKMPDLWIRLIRFFGKQFNMFCQNVHLCIFKTKSIRFLISHFDWVGLSFGLYLFHYLTFYEFNKWCLLTDKSLS